MKMTISKIKGSVIVACAFSAGVAVVLLILAETRSRSTGEAVTSGSRDMGQADKVAFGAPAAVADEAGVRPGPMEALGRIIELRKTGKYRPDYGLFDQEGLLTEKARDAASLSDEEASLVQAATAELIQTTAGHIRRSKILLQFPLNGEASYFIKPFPKEGAEAVERFVDALSTCVGKDRAWLLARSVPMETLGGGFGTQQVTYRIKKPDPVVAKGVTESEIKNLYRVEYEIRDPARGHEGPSGTGNWNYFNAVFFGGLE